SGTDESGKSADQRQQAFYLRNPTASDNDYLRDVFESAARLPGLADVLRVQMSALAAPVSVDMAKQLLRGLQAAHREGVLHLDLKPDNVMLAKDGSVRELLDGRRFNAASGGMTRWLQDGKSMLVRLVPDSRGPMPAEPVVPTGPVVQETAGKKAQVRTYQDLLKNQYDEQVFDWLITTQLAVLDVTTGSVRPVGEAGLWTGMDVSPDGQYLLAGRIARPYSYLVPSSQFGRVDVVMEMATGKVVKQLRQVGLRDQIPIEGVETGPRGFMWNDLAPAQLIYAEALDGGDPKNKADHRDQLFAWDAPFAGDPSPMLRTQHRFSGMSFLEPTALGNMLAMVSEYDRDRKWETTWLYDLEKPASEPRKMRDLSINDRYNDPGSPLSRLLPNGRSVARVDDGQLWLTGDGATPTGNRPFLDRESLSDFAK
ncbi:MAG: protein kinase domain-containing protein, partial [Phycisphaerales bacterium]